MERGKRDCHHDADRIRGVASFVTLVAIAGSCAGGGTAGRAGTRSMMEVAGEALSSPPACITIQRAIDGDVADTYIGSDAPAGNHGSERRLFVGGAGSDNQTRQVLLRFDLSAVPPGAIITSATITLDTPLRVGLGAAVRAHRVKKAWSESTLTYGNFHGKYNDRVEAELSFGSPSSLSLVKLAQGWVNGGYRNYGVLLEGDGPGAVLFSSSEALDVRRQPKLEVCYEACVGPGVCQSVTGCHERAVGVTPTSIVLGDFNRDGTLDMLAPGDGGSDEVSVLLSDGDGSFEDALTSAVGAHSNAVAVGDFNRDGKLDIAVADRDENVVGVALGKGDGAFESAQTFAVGALPAFAVARDLDGDGKLDIVVANESAAGTVSVLMGVGDGTFDRFESFAVGAQPSAVAMGDFDGDGVPDMAVAARGSNGVSVLLGKGDGTFQAAQTFAAGRLPVSVAVADFDADGNLDIVVAARGSNGVSVLLGNGDGTFQAAQTFAAGQLPASVVVGDFDDDGNLDIAAVNHVFYGTVSVLLGNGDGTFRDAQTVQAGHDPSAVVVGDFDRDGELDLAVADTGSGAVSMLLGNGDGTFQDSCP